MNDLNKRYKSTCKEDHPFPIKEIELSMKIYKENILNKEDLETISNLISKYLDLRADVFHEI